ncbi:hypothetical protein REPUB_Repub06bG0128200 [Reevesia pubescens]
MLKKMNVGTWEAPPHRFLKFNVDGFVMGKLEPGGIGGVLRNEDGIMLLVFSKSVGIVDSNTSEFLRSKRPLRFLWVLNEALLMD